MLFKKVCESSAEFGLGDLQSWAIVDRFRQCEVPLVRLIGGDKLPRYGEALPIEFENWRVRITEMGILVHECKRDHLFLNGIDDWIGGVHLLGKKDIWRRNGISKGFVNM
jgi:hypothetical protein